MNEKLEITSEVLLQKPKESLQDFVDTMNEIRDLDENTHELIANQVRYYKGVEGQENPIQYLEDRWFKSIEENNDNIDYSVYGDMNYCADAWACWNIYSRANLRNIAKSKFLFEDIKTVLDVGCGIGKTSSALSEIFSEAKVTGTNLKGTEQWAVCEQYQKKFDFDLLEDSKELGDVDILFANEYFEHILAPIEHLDEIIENNHPKYLIIANSFGTVGIGHFLKYKVGDIEIDWKKISAMFNARIRHHGYEKVDTGFWNNTPNVWKKIDEQDIANLEDF